MVQKYGFLGRQYIPPIFEELYHWAPLKNFLSSIVTRARHPNSEELDCEIYQNLYNSEDPHGAVYFYVGNPGAVGAMHYDQHPFSCVWMLQPAMKGGETLFKFLPPTKNVRRTDGFPWEKLEVVRDRSPDDLQSLRAKAGDVYCFKGNVTIHGVQKVEGERDRIALVTAFADFPGFTHMKSIEDNNDWSKSGKQNHDEL